MSDRMLDTAIFYYAQDRYLPPDWWDERGIAADILSLDGGGKAAGAPADSPIPQTVRSSPERTQL